MKWIKFGLAVGVFIGMVFPIGAQAGDWVSCVDESASGNIGSRSTLCFEPTTANLTSDLLDISKCENVDALYDDDQADTSGSATCEVMNCVAPSVSANHCNAVAGVTLTGQSPYDAIYGFAGAWVYVVCTDPDSETPRILLHCNP
jgi:hypothetical protein